ncbi:hypothetical protein ESCO_004817 [Escovopsis weberi]|uniref:Pentatricopeptide repeat-containing protein n=1 Tax=Escovopsis weberi TaxID=150374 RepID=A0A0M9VRS5_ESCWE|nr:hypothetical protein ESCO_004817 [Escovopsis weberi]
MSCRPIIRDLRSRDHGLCRTCFLRLVKQPARPSWVSPFSSRASSGGREPRTGSLSRQQRTARQRPREELERAMRRLKLERELANETKSGADFSVRYFEQDDDNRRRELADEQAFEQSFGGLDASEIGSSLADFQAGLKTADEKNAFNAVLEEVGERWDNMKSAEDIERMIAKMEDYTRAVDQEIQDVGADLPPEALAELLGDLPDLQDLQDLQEDLPLVEEPAARRTGGRPHIPSIPDGSFSIAQRKKIGKLNRVIAKTWSESNKRTGLSRATVSLIHRAYHSARLGLSHHWGAVPLDVWDYLWNAFATDESRNPSRLSYISALALDMMAAKAALTPKQQLLAIEAVFVNGWEDTAMRNWRRCIGTLGAEASETFQDFWELGVRMSCRAGDMAQAEQAANKLLDRRMSPRILMPLICACCEQLTPESHEKAWATYRRMRELLGDDMRLTDYDQVIAYFLVANQVENGLYAFVDMMSNGQIDLRKQKTLPSVVANKFFFGKWLKRLIGAGNLAGAHSVVEFMERRGIEGASIQVNGLLGAWLRSGGSDDADRADALAWRMIEARIRFVNDRHAAAAAGSGRTRPRPPVAGLPRATLETFYLLAENYRQRSLHAKLSRLWDAFREAELKPDAAMMNPLLESHIVMGQWRDALRLYRTLVDGLGVAPDPYTFSALWKTLEINRLHFVPDARLSAAAAAARAMFADVVRFRHAFPPDAGIDGQLARKILHTFRRLKDQAGFLLALMALRDLFRFLPSDTLVMELVLNTTKLSWDTPAQRKKLMRAKQELDFALSGAGQGDRERGEALYRFLQKKYWSEFDTRGKDRLAILDAMAKEMGVHDVLAPKKDLAGLL